MDNAQHVVSIMYEPPRSAHPDHWKVRLDLEDVGKVYRQKSHDEMSKDDHEGRWVWMTKIHCSLDPTWSLGGGAWKDQTPVSYLTRMAAVLAMLTHLERTS